MLGNKCFTGNYGETFAFMASGSQGAGYGDGLRPAPQVKHIYQMVCHPLSITLFFDYSRDKPQMDQEVSTLVLG